MNSTKLKLSALSVLERKKLIPIMFKNNNKTVAGASRSYERYYKLTTVNYNVEVKRWFAYHVFTKFFVRR